MADRKILAARKIPTAKDQQEKESWEDEDPNLLNDPVLLFKEAESLPLPDHAILAAQAEMQKAVSAMRKLYQENNLVLDRIRKRKNILANKVESYTVFKNIVGIYNDLNMQILNSTVAARQKVAQPLWNNTYKSYATSAFTARKMKRWQKSFDGFLKRYTEIKKFIPEEMFNQPSDPDFEKKQWEEFNLFPKLMEEFDAALKILEDINDFND